MAGDTRDSLPSPPNREPRGPPPGTSTTEPPAHIQSSSPKVYEVFHSTPPSPPPSANALPEGSGLNTAGAESRKEPPSLTEAIKTVRLGDFKQVHMYPCVRESLLMGIGGGFGIGGVRALLGGTFFPTISFNPGCFVCRQSILQLGYSMYEETKTDEILL